VQQPSFWCDCCWSQVVSSPAAFPSAHLPRDSPPDRTSALQRLQRPALASQPSLVHPPQSPFSLPSASMRTPAPLPLMPIPSWTAAPPGQVRASASLPPVPTSSPAPCLFRHRLPSATACWNRKCQSAYVFRLTTLPPTKYHLASSTITLGTRPPTAPLQQLCYASGLAPATAVLPSSACQLWSSHVLWVGGCVRPNIGSLLCLLFGPPLGPFCCMCICFERVLLGIGIADGPASQQQQHMVSVTCQWVLFTKVMINLSQLPLPLRHGGGAGAPHKRCFEHPTFGN
jgi:hypothetical protein